MAYLFVCMALEALLDVLGRIKNKKRKNVPRIENVKKRFYIYGLCSCVCTFLFYLVSVLLPCHIGVYSWLKH